jgi:hypothetical protein
MGGEKDAKPSPLSRIPIASYFSPRTAEFRAEMYAEQGKLALARMYQEDALRTQELNQHWVSFSTPANLATDALTDHLHLQQVLGFTDVSDLRKGLSKEDQEQVAEELDVAEKTIREDQDQLNAAMSAAMAAQREFIGIGQQLNGVVAGKARREIEGKKLEQEKERQAINQKIKDAGLMGKRIQAVIELAVNIFSFDAANAAKAAKSIAGVSKSTGDSALGSSGLIGGIVEWFASEKYKKQLQDIDTKIQGLGALAEGAAAVEQQQTYTGLVNQLQGKFQTLAASVEALAIKARVMRDVMRTPPKKQKGGQARSGRSAEEIAAEADAKDPAKRVELLVTSAMATSTLLDGGMRAATPVLSVFGQRLVDMAQKRPDEDIDRETPKGQAPSKGDDHYALQKMTEFASLWYQQAYRHKEGVDAEAAQIPKLKGAG